MHSNTPQIPNTQNTNYDLATLCKRLRISQSAKEAIEKKESTKEAIVEIFTKEVQNRDINLINRNIAKANFPAIKTLDNYDFSGVEMPQEVSSKYFLDGEFVKNRDSVFMYGRPGVGKTHLSIAIALNACNRGFRVMFYRINDLIKDIIEAQSDNRYSKFCNKMKKLDLLIIDELGFISQNSQSLLVFFEFYCSVCYENMSLIATSNLNFEEFLERFPNDRLMCEALVDRIVHRSFLFRFVGQSHRLGESPMC